MTAPLVLRPATSVDTADLERLAALDSARPLEGEVLLAYAGGDVRAALSLESGRVVADPFYPSAELVELLRAAGGTPPPPLVAPPGARRAPRARLAPRLSPGRGRPRSASGGDVVGAALDRHPSRSS